VRACTIARALAPWGESGVRVRVKTDMARLKCGDALTDACAGRTQEALPKVDPLDVSYPDTGRTRSCGALPYPSSQSSLSHRSYPHLPVVSSPPVIPTTDRLWWKCVPVGCPDPFLCAEASLLGCPKQ
jgi:hypothetical protein